MQVEIVRALSDNFIYLTTNHLIATHHVINHNDRYLSD